MNNRNVPFKRLIWIFLIIASTSFKPLLAETQFPSYSLGFDKGQHNSSIPTGVAPFVVEISSNKAPVHYSQPLTIEHVYDHWVITVLTGLFFLIIALLFFYIRVRKSWSNIIEHEWSHALDFMNDPIYMVDLNDRIIKANKAFYKKVGTTEKQAVGKLVTNYTHPEGEEIPCKVCQARKNLVDTSITLEANDPVNKANIPMKIGINVIRDTHSKPVAIIQSMHDLSEVRKNETMLSGVLNSTPDPLIVTDMQGIITIVNSQFEAKFGYTRNEIIGKEVEILLPDFLREKHKGLRKSYQEKPNIRPMGMNMELTGQHKDGALIPLEISLSPVTVNDELFVISSLHDITQRKTHKRELKRLARFPADAPIPILEVDIHGNITYANPEAEQQLPKTDTGSYYEVMQERIDGLIEELSSNNNVLIREKELNKSVYEQNIIYLPELERIHIYSWNITRMHEMSAQMTFHATHDSLTGLPNRREFENQLEKAIMSAAHENKSHVLCYMDLDQFKTVNDTCGHIAGDELLKQLPSLLKTHIRDSDTLARIGGDEFALLLSGCNISIAENIAEKVRKEIEAFHFHWDGKEFQIGVSIGLVLIEKSPGKLSELLDAADTACYIAKNRGRNQIYTFKQEDYTSITRLKKQVQPSE